MADGKHMFFAAIGSLVVLILGIALLAWPNHRQMRTVLDEVAVLEKKVSSLGAQTVEVERLACEYSDVKRRVEAQFKEIPETPDISGLIRKLSLPVDGTTILDQTFTAGSANSAVAGQDAAELVMPLNIDMVANFDSVFALICAAESMERLVRVSSMHLVAERGETEGESPMVMATVGLEAVFEPSAVEEVN